MNTATKTDAARLVWVDVFKGILIILMVMGHAGSPMNNLIYLFHMSGFIFLSGYTCRVEGYSLWEYTKRKVLTILVPFFLVNTGFFAFYRILRSTPLYALLQPDARGAFSLLPSLAALFQRIATTDFGGATWFLVVLFWAEMIYMLVYKFLAKFNHSAIAPYVCIALGCLGHALAMREYYLAWNLDLGLFALLFYSLGVLYSKYNIFNIISQNRPVQVVCFSVAVLFGLCIVFPSFMNWPTRAFPPLGVNILVFACMIYVWYCLAQWLSSSDFFARTLGFVGRHTFAILILHFFAFRIVGGGLYLLHVLPVEALGWLAIPGEIPGLWILYTLLSLGICLFIAWLAEKKPVTDYLVNARLRRKQHA